MAGLKRKDTGPELELRRALHKNGLRFRLHRRDLPGRPDIVFASIRLAIFVDGCFWHGCPEHRVKPKSNTQFWEAKIVENQQRDRRNDLKLTDMGWTVMHIWEHEDPKEVAQRVLELWQKIKGASTQVLVPQRRPDSDS